MSKRHRRSALDKDSDDYQIRRGIVVLNQEDSSALPVQEHAAGGEPDPPLVGGVAPAGEPQLSLGDHSDEDSDEEEWSDPDLDAFETSTRQEETPIGSKATIAEKHCFLLCHAARGSLSRNLMLSLSCELLLSSSPIHDFQNFSGRLCRAERTAFRRAVWCDECCTLDGTSQCCAKEHCTRLLYYRPLELILNLFARRFGMEDLVVHEKEEASTGFWGSPFLSQLEAKPPQGHGMRLLGAPLSAWALGTDGACPLASSTYGTLLSHNVHVLALQCLNVPSEERGTMRSCEVVGLISSQTLDGVQRDPKAPSFAAAVGGLIYRDFERDYFIHGKAVKPYLIFSDGDTPAAAKLHAYKSHQSKHPCLYCRCNRVAHEGNGPLVHRLAGEYWNLHLQERVTPEQVPRLNSNFYSDQHTILRIAATAKTDECNGTPITCESFQKVPSYFRAIWGTRIPTVHKLLGLGLGALRTVFPSGESPDPTFAVNNISRKALKKSLAGVPKARACPIPAEHLFQKDVARGVKALKLHDCKAVMEWHMPILLAGHLFHSDHKAARLLSAIRNAVLTVFTDPFQNLQMKQALDTLAEVLEGCGNTSLRQHNAHVLTQHLGEQSDQLGPPAFNSEWWVERMVKSAVSAVKRGHHRGRGLIATIARSIAEDSLAKLFAAEVLQVERHECRTISKVPALIQAKALKERQCQVRETREGGVELLRKDGALVGIAGRFGAARRRVELRLAGTPGFLTFDDTFAFLHEGNLRFAWLHSIRESSVLVRAVLCELVHTKDGIHWFERPDDHADENLELTFSDGIVLYPCSFVRLKNRSEVEAGRAYVVCGPVPPAAPQVEA